MASQSLRLRYDRVKNISLFSQLLLYKFISYSAQNRCFKNTNFIFDDHVFNQLVKSGFWVLIESHLKNKEIAEQIFKEYRTQYTSYPGHFFPAPIKLMRNDNLRFKHIQEFTSQINSFYSYDDKIVSLVSTCLCETT